MFQYILNFHYRNNSDISGFRRKWNNCCSLLDQLKTAKKIKNPFTVCEKNRFINLILTRISAALQLEDATCGWW